MKLEPLFTIKDNKLYKLADNKEMDINTVKKIELPWSVLELEPESYNEEYLAELRENLKEMEEKDTFAIIVPIADKNFNDTEDQDSFIAAYNHCARRIKDCTSVIGFEIPEEIESQEDFVDTLSKKHQQYIYFTKAENTLQDRIITY